jgi:hypothetical protein
VSRGLLSIAAVIGFAACAPYRVEPAVGTTLDYRFCGGTASMVYVYARNAPCPSLAMVQSRAATIEERYTVSLAGAKLFVTGAAVWCADGERYGCTVGDEMTVTHGPLLGGLVEHEMSHVAINRRGGDADLGHMDLDERRSRIRNTILRGDAW